MFDTIKKGLYLGFGAIAITKEKAEQLVDELVKKGEAAVDEKPELVKKILERAEEQEKKVTDLIDSAVRKAVDKAKVATKDDIAQLKGQINALKEKLK
ncbi:polyhydroxyalkanoate synthesis regulator [bacterium]|nr:polyhydroxyalkanoate synthesis regulator [bacterium]